MSGRWRSLALVLAVAGCGPVVIIVNDGGLDASDCGRDEDCAAESFCNKASCDDARGLCTLRGYTFSTDVLPVCGCDNVTYLNVFRLYQQGMSQKSLVECTSGMCDDAHPCPAGATCARIGPPNQCALAHGRCWNVPPSCNWAPGAFYSCATGACTDLCSAMHGDAGFTSAQTEKCP